MKELKGTQTEKNLLQAFSAESQARNAYTYFASIAKKEGYEHIASVFLEIASNEKDHEKTFQKLLHLLRNKIFFEGDGKTYKWKCKNCGHIHTGKTPPKICPVCAHAQSYFEIENEDVTI